jgi:peptidoglycan/LPS O-acetylase OafA/YrhL
VTNSTGRRLAPSNLATAAPAYDPSVIPPTLLAAFLVGGLLALVPVSRLRAADWPPSLLAAYWIGLVALSLAAATGVGLRVALPILLVGYVAPIVVVRVRRARRPDVVTRR